MFALNATLAGLFLAASTRLPVMSEQVVPLQVSKCLNLPHRRVVAINEDQRSSGHDRCFRVDCLGNRGEDTEYYAHAAHLYALPNGWRRVTSHLTPKQEGLLSPWVPVYHGTRISVTQQIINPRNDELADYTRLGVVRCLLPRHIFLSAPGAIEHPKAYFRDESPRLRLSWFIHRTGRRATEHLNGIPNRWEIMRPGHIEHSCPRLSRHTVAAELFSPAKLTSCPPSTRYCEEPCCRIHGSEDIEVPLIGEGPSITQAGTRPDTLRVGQGTVEVSAIPSARIEHYSSRQQTHFVQDLLTRAVVPLERTMPTLKRPMPISDRRPPYGLTLPVEGAAEASACGEEAVPMIYGLAATGMVIGRCLSAPSSVVHESSVLPSLAACSRALNDLGNITASGGNSVQYPVSSPFAGLTHVLKELGVDSVSCLAHNTSARLHFAPFRHALHGAVASPTPAIDSRFVDAAYASFATASVFRFAFAAAHDSKKVVDGEQIEGGYIAKQFINMKLAAADGVSLP